MKDKLIVNKMNSIVNSKLTKRPFLKLFFYKLNYTKRNVVANKKILKLFTHNYQKIIKRYRTLEFFGENPTYTHAENVDSDRFRNLLYPNSDDPIIKKLNECASVDNVFEIINESIEYFNADQTNQTVLVLWDLQRTHYNVSTMLLSDSDDQTDIGDIRQQYIDKVTSHKQFQRLLKKIETIYQNFDLNVLSCILLYLSKIGISIRHEIMQKLILKFEEDIYNVETDPPLQPISRFLIAVFRERGLYPILVSHKLYPLVFNAIEKCECPEEFRLITISLNCLHQIVSKDDLCDYKNKAEELLEKNIFEADHITTIVKILRFLNYPHWAIANANCIRKLLIYLDGKLSSLENWEISTISKVLASQMEPKKILLQLEEIVYERYYDQYIDQTSTDILSHVVANAAPTKRQLFEKIARHYVQSSNQMTFSIIPIVFNILRYIKISDYQLYYKFWQKCLEYLQKTSEDREDYKLFRICHYYMHFNNNLAGTFRHFEFESQMFEWLIEELNDRGAELIPSKFSRAFQFLIAYGFTSKYNKNVLNYLIDAKSKFFEMAPQFNHIDCLNLSRGLRIAIELQRKSDTNPLLLDYFQIVNVTLNKRTKEILELDQSPIGDLNNILKSYINRNAPVNVPLFEQLINKYTKLFKSNDISSRIVRDACYTCNTTSCLVPDLVEYLTGYVTQNNEYVLADTVEKVLNLCYYLGYTPHNINNFIEVSRKIIEEEKHRLSGLTVIQASLSLAYFQNLPLSLIMYIFSEQFLDQVDNEIKNCFSKMFYPVRVRNALMQLNRAVCLDMPESNIPWFHENFCEDLKRKERSNNSALSQNIFSYLLHIVGGQEFIQRNVYTPYGYKIDYGIHLDKYQRIISTKQNEEPLIKIAFIILSPQSITMLNPNLKGYHQLQHRHLEILGYRVVFINPVLWYSEFMNEQANKIEYLMSQIWPESIQNKM